MAATNEEWAKRANRFMKAELKRAGVTYEELAKRLSEIGVDETIGSVTVKINRGAYPAWWLFLVMKVIGRENIRIEDL